MNYCVECGDPFPPKRAELGYPFPPKRAELGYSTCLSCGDEHAQHERMGWTIVPTPKGHYTRITNREELKHLNQKSR
jgi:hypothetical protein